MASKIDVIISVCGKPWQTALALLSLERSCGQHIDRIYFVEENTQAGRFTLPGAKGMLAELRELLAHTGFHGQFFSNHASNYVPLALRLPRDREQGLVLLDRALAGQLRLKEERSRRL